MLKFENEKLEETITKILTPYFDMVDAWCPKDIKVKRSIHISKAMLQLYRAATS